MKKVGLFFMYMLFIIIPTLAQTTDMSPELDEQVRSIEDFVSEYRGLPILSPTTLKIWTSEEIRQTLSANIEADEVVVSASVDPEKLLYRALGFVGQDFDYTDIYLDVILPSIGGFYDQYDKTLNMILPNGVSVNDEWAWYLQAIYAHEFVHALQDQHFDIANLLDTDTTSLSYDQYLAMRSLIEGDAELVRRDFMSYLVNNNMVDFNSSPPPQGDAPQTPVPDIFIEQFSFMYSDGVGFATYLYSNGRWDAINDAYTNLPQSTEQILQPRKYLSGDVPIPVELADISDVLGADWQNVFTDTLGLFYIREYIGQYVSGGVVYIAVNGWGGDTISVYHQPDTDELAWVLGITWDDPIEKELREFGDGYTQFLENQFDEFTDTPFCGVSDTQTICFASTATTSLIASAPTTDLAQALLTRVTQE